MAHRQLSSPAQYCYPPTRGPSNTLPPPSTTYSPLDVPDDIITATLPRQVTSDHTHTYTHTMLILLPCSWSINKDLTTVLVVGA